jgi:hypothetical protein
VHWPGRYPRLLTKTQMRELAQSGHSRLLAVSDVSCDVEGSIEFLSHTTPIEQPFFTYLPTSGQTVPGVDPRCVVGVVGVGIAGLRGHPVDGGIGLDTRRLLLLLPTLQEREGGQARSAKLLFTPPVTVPPHACSMPWRVTESPV